MLAGTRIKILTIVSVFVWTFCIACATTNASLENAIPTPTEEATEQSSIKIPLISTAEDTVEPLAPTQVIAATEIPTIAATDIPIVVETPIPSETPLPTETPTEYPTQLPTWTPTPEPLNTPRPIPTDATEINENGQYCAVGVDPFDTLNIRAEMGADSEIIGTIPAYGQSISVTGIGRDVGQSEWVPIDYYGRTGFVNATFLAHQIGEMEAEPASAALHTVVALRAGDTGNLSEHIHPEKGVMFVPYTHIYDQTPVFMAGAVADLWQSQEVFDWGTEPGTGDQISLTFQDFYSKYLYSLDFLFADIVGYDTNIVEGGMIDNSRDIFPDAHSVEYHIEGVDPDFGGFDYQTLRIVVEEFQGSYYTTAIIHNAWTP